MAEIFDLSTTDASNTGRFPENQAPSTLNNGARALEGLVARGLRDTIIPTQTSGGAANVQTLTTNQTVAAYAAGTSAFVFKAGFTNTGATTLNVNTLGAKDIRDLAGNALVGGEIQVGGYYSVVYSSAGWFILLNSYFTVTARIQFDATVATGVGFRGEPQNTQNGTYAFVAADAGKSVYHSSSSNHTWTIPLNSSVPFPIGTVITLVVTDAIVTVARAVGVALYLADGNPASSANRTVTRVSVAELRKVDTDTWVISGRSGSVS